MHKLRAGQQFYILKCAIHVRRVFPYTYQITSSLQFVLLIQTLQAVLFCGIAVATLRQICREFQSLRSIQWMKTAFMQLMVTSHLTFT